MQGWAYDQSMNTNRRGVINAPLNAFFSTLSILLATSS
ncbi:hypothetical protein YSA_00151 [Pseudomonas putida ND6]|uniref:Uncharacterized protein n=1 Tax=Pseudomonas putida ND6 TaxID=231023 RepID=I3UMY9_PSEPU|nr:hypothetical protein YSA_00151 [Pseudomonas putida ND6]